MQYWCGKMVNGSTSRISTETKRIYSEDLEPPKPIPTYKWIHFLRIIMVFVLNEIILYDDIYFHACFEDIVSIIEW